MSGGSYDHAYLRVQEMAGQLSNSDSLLRRAFVVHLDKVAKAMHAIEWVDSCDWGDGDDEAPIRAVLAPGDELSVAIAEAEKARAELEAALCRAKGASE